MAGTRWVQKQLLDKHSSDNLRVYAIWFDMFPGDARSEWPPDLLSDRRVTHWWDEGKAAGRWYGDRKPQMRHLLTADSEGTGGQVLWDAYLLYGAEARWEGFPTGLIHWGRTIVAARDTLRRDLDLLFRPAANNR